MNNNHIAKYNTSIGWSTLLIVAGFELGLSLPSFGQQIVANRFPVLTPESSIKRVEDAGVKAHTHLRVLLVDNASASESASFNTPASIRSAYSLPSTGGSNAIAIVDAYDYPTALSDFNRDFPFDLMFTVFKWLFPAFHDISADAGRSQAFS